MRPSLENSRIAMEAEYSLLLRRLLVQCAEGRWGLFGQNERALEALSKAQRDKLVPPEVDELLELGQAIESIRARLGFAEAFEPHKRLTAMRLSKSANTVGEPKLAQRWLNSLQDT